MLFVKHPYTGIGILAVTLAVVLAGRVESVRGEPVLSEIMALNESTLRDVDGEFTDWFEVENQGPGSLNLDGYFATDDAFDLIKWRFPDVEVPEGGRLVVFASGKDKATDTGGGFAQRPSTLFSHALEFTADGVLPSVEGAGDGWIETGSWVVGGNQPPSITARDGLLVFDSTGQGSGGGRVFDIQQPDGDSAWSSEITPSMPYTFEVRLRVTGGIEGAGGVANPGVTIWIANGNGAALALLRTDQIRWGIDDPTPIHTGDNQSEFVVFRLAYDGATYSMWRDGVSIASGLSAARSDSREAMFLIDFGSSSEAAGEFDYIRWEAGGAYAPEGAASDLQLHTNFGLDADGEFFALVAPDGATVVSSFFPTFPPQRADVSYGPEGYYLVPTPGAPNSASVIDFATPPQFSAERGYYDTPFEVTLSSETEAAQFRYTTNGTKPSVTEGILYDAPIPIDTTTTLRVISFKEDFGPSRVATHTYLFPADILRQTGAGFPINSDWDYAVDPNVVDDPRFAANMEDDLKSLPALSIVLPVEDMFGSGGIHANPTAGGDAWEREASVEWIHADGEPSHQIDAGIRIHGAGSRRRALGKKSFRLAFRKEYGSGKLNMPVLGPEGPAEFDGLVLRGNYFDSWSVHTSGDGESIGWDAALLFRDRFGYTSQRDTGNLALRGNWVHLYIDGLYWGVYNAIERPDEEFAATHLGGNPEDYDILKQGNPPEVVNGDRGAWNELLDLVKGSITLDSVYQQVPERLDVENFIDYIILNLYGGNQDWPHNNWYALRNRTRGDAFTFIAWDTENYIFRLAESGKLTTSVDNSPGILYDRLRRNAEFRVQFGDHVHRFFFNGGAFTPEANAARFQAIVDELILAMDPESARWGDTRLEPPLNTIDPWQVTIADKLNRYFPQRTNIVLNQFRSIDLYPEVEAPSYAAHGGPIEPGFRLTVQAPAGTIYYTADESDPRLRGGAPSPEATELGSEGVTLLAEGAAVRAWVPTDGSLGSSWTSRNFDDSAWSSGTTGVGFERSAGFEDLIGLDVEAEAYNINESVFLRVPFTFDGDPTAVGALTLRMKYDDGFAAYLNGELVAERNTPEELTWNAGAIRGHTDSAATVFESMDITDGIDALRAGDNVLAIHGLNAGANSSDLLFLPELRAVLSSDSGLTLTRTTQINSRALVDGEWSALNSALFVVDSSAFRVTELMYHPPAPSPESPFQDEDFEFIEFQNTGNRPLNLLGVRISGAVEFVFPGSPSELDDLQPGEFVVVVNDLAAFSTRYDASSIRVAGEYRGRLENSSERLLVEDGAGRSILDFRYQDLWYPATDGLGKSLEIVDPTAPPSTWNDAPAWKASTLDGGTPGSGDSVSTGRQTIGNLNQDRALDISDAVSLLTQLFLGGGAPPCGGDSVTQGGNRTLADFNGDASVDLTDPVALLTYLFLSGPEPPLGLSCISIPGCPEVCVE